MRKIMPIVATWAGLAAMTAALFAWHWQVGLFVLGLVLYVIGFNLLSPRPGTKK